jgi:hypothetical protein
MSGSCDDDDDDVPPISNAPLSFPDCLNGRTVSLALVLDGILQSPKKLYAQIIRVLKFFKRQKLFFAHHRRQQALPPLGCVVAECSPCGRVRIMLPCVATACHRLVTAPADMHMAHMSWSWAEVVMERVTRGRVRRVQVRLQRRACCAVRCAHRASACVRCVFEITRAAGNAGWFSGPLLRIAAAASSAPRRSFLCAGCCCRPRCRRTRHCVLGSKRRRCFGSLPCDC